MPAAKTVLLVDDDRVILTLMQTVLERKGYRVYTAMNGNEALALAEREAPDLVVLDMMMPQKSGLLVLEKLKSFPNIHPRVIMVTANEVERFQTFAEAHGVDDYIRKPFTVERFLESVARLCPIDSACESVQE